MEFRLLGRLEIASGGRLLELKRRRERCLLGVLLLQPNRPISIDRLIDLLWEGEPPPAARASLHTHVSRLRAALAPGGHDPSVIDLVGDAGGYSVRVDPDRVDTHRFRELIGRAQATEGDERVELLRQAISLWRGPLLADTASPRLRIRVGSELAELRMSAAELMFEAELAAGRHREVIDEISELVEEQPYRERLTGQLMLALYRCDRHEDALSAYRRLCARLSEDLGVDPGPELRALQDRMLRGDRGLVTVPHSPAGVPAQLPAAPRWFTARASELAELTKMLDGTQAEAVGSDVIAMIVGAGGIGKTWLALHWGHLHRDRFPDGQLFVNLHGFDPTQRPMSTATAVRGLLIALGVAPDAIPRELAAQVGLYRSLVAARRMLIVLDNARDTAQVVDLLPGSLSCMVIVTSRNRLTGLISAHTAHPMLLDVLAESAARDLLAGRLGEHRLTGEPDALATLLSACGGLPLALSVTAARVVTQPQAQLAEIAAELRDTATRLQALDDSDPQASLRAVMSWSYASLPFELARLFALLGAAPGPDISLTAACALAGLATDETRAALRALERQSLVQQHVEGRWRMHDLIRLYAGERAVIDLSAGEREAAARRLADFYVHAAHASDRLLDPHRPPIEVDPFDGPVLPVSDPAEALAWFSAEHACLVAVQDAAATSGWDRAVWQLAWTLNTFHQRQGLVDDDLRAWRAGAAATDRIGDPTAQTRAYRLLGHACARIGRHQESIQHLRRALTLAEEAGDIISQAHAHSALAGNCGLSGDFPRALRHAQRGLDLHEFLDDPVWKADALNTVGWYEAQLGQYEQAHDHCVRALELCRRHADHDGEAHTLDSLGYIVHRTGQLDSALTYYREALRMFRKLGNAYGEADSLDQLGEVHRDLGDLDEAAHDWGQALTMYRTQRRVADADRVQQHLDRIYR
ncbi:AfsR/SARP family transcriptional regulator [Rugosimonospora africana]|uniref:SARP family transcriptional regulator n=1 Tax=Rugosimonospora africana TaxID=556532 RepID=A0A8J3R0N3_9ACTN|nr:BTAD domain-containing putative transcriptional regulator [Rugosimonospora africana]GIH20041.1 SARP family transcriptional regulator [Rugosimonospora africana]